MSERAKWLLQYSAWLMGWRLLSKAQTLTVLKPYELTTQSANQVELPATTDALEADQLVFGAKVANTLPAYVWQMPMSGSGTSVLPSGTVRRNGDVLCTDYWNHHVLYDRLWPRQRSVVEVDTVVAPFGHLPDMVAFGGYYDFICLITAKLCRIQQALPGASFADMAITYPLFGTPYEQEVLTHLGFSPDRIYDSRLVDVRANQYVLGSGGDWFYPNRADMEAVRVQLSPLIASSMGQPGERLYISRTGRRRIRNEESLMGMLSRYGFTYIDDKPRSIGEQLTMYQQASFILGPHGASFANINWCQPGTYLHEFCSINYAPDFFLYLAMIRGMHYSVSRHGEVRQQSMTQSLIEDITVPVDETERWLNRRLANGLS